MKTRKINLNLIILIILSIILFKYLSNKEEKIEKIEKIEICTETSDVKIKSTYSSLVIPDDKKITHPSDNAISNFHFKVSGILIEIKSKSGLNYYVEGINQPDNKKYWINSDLLTNKSFLNKEELILKIKLKICDTKED